MKENVLKLINQNSIRLEQIQKITNIPLEELELTIQELMDEKLIFLNTSNKYEAINNDYLIGTLEKTSKSSCYVTVGEEKIPISSDSLHTALKNDLVVVERKYGNYGSIKGILKRKNERLVCEVKE